MIVAEQLAEQGVVGTVLEGCYRIEKLISQGGMGAVYEATHLRLRKRVAVKILIREQAATRDELARFQREALITSALGHPHIVQVVDFSKTPAGDPFLVMELLKGEDLEHRIGRVGPLTQPQTVRMIRQVASALTATHAKMIVHRDLKPANIFLVDAAGATDFVKVLDFGISKVRGATVKLTQEATVIGTPQYMSPEQATGRIHEIDERTDQWALACIAWECLTGDPLFSGECVSSILYRIVHVPMPALPPNLTQLHPHLERVLQRALSKEKSGRFPNVDDFADAFEQAVLGGLQPEARPLSSATAGPTSDASESGEDTMSPHSQKSRDTLVGLPGRRKMKWTLAIAASVLLALGGLLLFRTGSSARPMATPEPPASAATSALAVPVPVSTSPPVPAPVARKPEAAGSPSKISSRKGSPAQREDAKAKQSRPFGWNGKSLSKGSSDAPESMRTSSEEQWRVE